MHGEAFFWLDSDAVRQRLREKLREGDILLVVRNYYQMANPSYTSVAVVRGGDVIKIPRKELVFADMPQEEFAGMVTDKELKAMGAQAALDSIDWTRPLEGAAELLRVANLYGVAVIETQGRTAVRAKCGRAGLRSSNVPAALGRTAARPA